MKAHNRQIKCRCFALWLALALPIVGCESYRLPSDLKFPQVLAVRLSQPQLLPGQRANIDVLVTDVMGVPAVINPQIVEFAPDPLTGMPLSLPPEAAMFIEHEGDKFFARAPDEATVDKLAALLGLAATAALKVQLRVTVAIGAESRRADKFVVVLRPGSGVEPTGNPTVTTLTIDGVVQPIFDMAPPVVLALVGEHTLQVSADETQGALTYAWFTAVGDLKHYRAPIATLTTKADEAGDGAGLIVVRNDRGGVAWRQFSLRVH